ncbi:MAG: trypsin-like peptidase domain-containing protein [Candidatus Omnitrophica bacterium]|nr:trypsin-like peptidase domain-containing protein [Candidatus Omnitrophota bacterium]
MKLKRNLRILITFFTIGIFFYPIKAIAQESVIQEIHLALPSIVEITAQNTMMFKGPESMAIDKETGQLVHLKGIKAAEYTRSGSGVIIDPIGVIATNAHIVSGASKIAVRLFDGKIISASPLLVIDQEDIAFIKINPPYPMTRIDFANSGTASIGDEVITVGSSPFLKKTMSAGRIIGFAKKGNPQKSNEPDFLHVNFNIYHGDSGGPLFNLKGQLLGLMVAGQMQSDRSSFSIPSNRILQFYLKYLQSKKEAN